MASRKVFLLAVLIALPLGILSGCLRAEYDGVPGFRESIGGSFRTTLDERTNCSNGQTVGEVDGRGNTTQEVDELIAQMDIMGFDAYIVPSSDAHLSEYTAEADKRREFISDFTGSAGTAVILANGTRALWTDGRYFIQADQQLDCTWILMKEGEPGVPSITEWLLDILPSGSNIGADGRLFTASTWMSSEQAVVEGGHTLEVETLNGAGENIVDVVWGDERPDYSLFEIFIHGMEYAGQEWTEKIIEMEQEMIDQNAELYVITMLDESAWLYNLRGYDVPYNPVFRAYTILDRSDRSHPVAYVFIPDIPDKVTQDVNDHLSVGDCSDLSLPCVYMYDYNQIETYLADLSGKGTVNSVMIPYAASYYIYNLVPEEKRQLSTSPAMLKKGKKNEVEQQSMKNAHIKDATAMFQFMTFFENEMAAGVNTYTEMSASAILDDYRRDQPLNMGLSFETISAFGTNSAIIHYTATNDTNAIITDESLYLLDSGGQYFDGTTDVTRTFHFGQPDDIMIEAYTRVLMGQIDMATLVFPVYTSQRNIEILTRRPLYEVGWDFNHGPSHGIGMFLNVHESSNPYYEMGWHGSDEPGFYKDGYFGVRLENTVAVVDVTTKYDFYKPAFGFETLTLFPYEEKLINVSMLTARQCAFVNDHYLNIRNIMGEHLNNLELTAEWNYMMTKTTPLNC